MDFNTQDYTNQFNPQDIEQNKAMAILSYIGILFLVPLFASKDSPYAKYHTNQGLILFLAEVIWNVVLGVFRAILNLIDLGFLANILSIFSLAFLALMIIGIINAVNGKAKDLPVIGYLRILK